MSYINKICESCGKQFRSKTGKRKCCSKSCEQRHELTCIKCGKTYHSTNKDSKFCSIRCRVNSQIYEKRNCKICGIEFYPKFKKQICCSKICSQKNIRSYETNILWRIWQRDNFTCIYCGKSSINDGVKLRIDHVYPINRGGKNDLFNLVTSCENCNAHKNDRLLNEKTIMRIWLKNEKLNQLKLFNSYEELKELFEKYFRERINKFNQNTQR